MSEPTRCRPLAICIRFLWGLSKGEWGGVAGYERPVSEGFGGRLHGWSLSPNWVNTVNPWQAMRYRALVSRGEGCQLDQARPVVRPQGGMPPGGEMPSPVIPGQ